MDSPFSVVDPEEGYAFEAATSDAPLSPFKAAPALDTPPPFWSAPPVAPQPAAPRYTSPAEVPIPQAPAAATSNYSSIPQLELRAIFRVAHLLSTEEILQHCRALPGIRNIAHIGTRDIASLEILESLLTQHGFAPGQIKLYSGSVPLEFIREGKIVLAIHAEQFAPGIREILIIVARELDRMA